MHTLTPDEVRRLFEVAAEDRLEALYILAVTTGMRRGELLGLHWADVDLDGGSVTVQATLQRMPQGLVRDEAKTDYSSRRIALHPHINQ